MLLSTEGAFRVSIDCYDTAWSGHFELEISIVWHRVESGKSSPSEQCVIATSKGYDIEDQVFTTEVVRRAKYNFQHYGARAAGLYARYYSFKGSFCGLDS